MSCCHGFRLIIDLQKIEQSQLPSCLKKQRDAFSEKGFFVGNYTLEVDIMEKSQSNQDAKKIICEVFNELTTGGDKQKRNFAEELDQGEYFKCLRKIEDNIGKGRFAQRLSSICIKEQIPDYIKNAIDEIYKRVSEI
mgnify:CR=1 FL=1